MTEPLIEVIQTSKGEKLTYSGKNGKKEAVIGAAFTVYIDGVVIGHVVRELQTRESRTRGRIYVNRRWESPAWVRYSSRGGHGFEEYSKADAVRRAVFFWEREIS